MTGTERVLTRALDLIGEYGWTQDAFARDAEGNSVNSASPLARSFCAVGACHRAQGEVRASNADCVHAMKLLDDLAKSAGHTNITYFNDERDIASVRSLFQAAIMFERGRAEVTT